MLYLLKTDAKIELSDEIYLLHILLSFNNRQQKKTPDLDQMQWPMLLRSGEHICFSGAQRHHKSKHACLCVL